MDLEGLADDVADRHARVQRRVRVLQDDLDLAAEPAQVARPSSVKMSCPLYIDLARRRAFEHHQQLGQRRLAAAGLADQAERLAALQVEGDAVDRLDVADLLLEDDPLGEREVLHDVPDLAGSPHRSPWSTSSAEVTGALRCPRRPRAAPARRSCRSLARAGSAGGTSTRTGCRARFGGWPVMGVSFCPLGSTRGIELEQPLGVRVRRVRVDVRRRPPTRRSCRRTSPRCGRRRPPTTPRSWVIRIRPMDVSV